MFNKKIISIFLVFALLFSVCYLPKAKKAYAFKKPNLTVVIDAGHGGKDWGTQGTLTGVKESDLNLEYANTLKQFFEVVGVKVVLTRKNEDALCEGRLIKLKDMDKRKQIIKEANPDFVISVHMNNFDAQPRQRGGQVFYQKGNKKSQALSTFVQKQFDKVLGYKRPNLAGDYYILRELNIPSVIAECGFLSNNEEEKLLQTKKHRQKVCYLIFSGAMQFVSH